MAEQLAGDARQAMIQSADRDEIKKACGPIYRAANTRDWNTSGPRMSMSDAEKEAGRNMDALVWEQCEAHLRREDEVPYAPNLIEWRSPASGVSTARTSPRWVGCRATRNMTSSETGGSWSWPEMAPSNMAIRPWRLKLASNASSASGTRWSQKPHGTQLTLSQRLNARPSSSAWNASTDLAPAH